MPSVRVNDPEKLQRLLATGLTITADVELGTGDPRVRSSSRPVPFVRSTYHVIVPDLPGRSEVRSTPGRMGCRPGVVGAGSGS